MDHIEELKLLIAEGEALEGRIMKMARVAFPVGKKIRMKKRFETIPCEITEHSNCCPKFLVRDVVSGTEVWVHLDEFVDAVGMDPAPPEGFAVAREL